MVLLYTDLLMQSSLKAHDEKRRLIGRKNMKTSRRRLIWSMTAATTFLACSLHASEAATVEVDSVNYSSFQSQPIGEHLLVSDLGPLALNQPGDPKKRWMTWDSSSTCSPPVRGRVQLTKSAVKRGCANGTIKSARKVKVKVTDSGPDQIVSRKGCRTCDTFNWEASLWFENAPYGQGFDFFEFEDGPKVEGIEKHRGENTLISYSFRGFSSIPKTTVGKNERGFLNVYLNVAKTRTEVFKIGG